MDITLSEDIDPEYLEDVSDILTKQRVSGLELLQASLCNNKADAQHECLLYFMAAGKEIGL